MCECVQSSVGLEDGSGLVLSADCMESQRKRWVSYRHTIHPQYQLTLSLAVRFFRSMLTKLSKRLEHPEPPASTTGWEMASYWKERVLGGVDEGSRGTVGVRTRGYRDGSLQATVSQLGQMALLPVQSRFPIIDLSFATLEVLIIAHTARQLLPLTRRT